MAFIERQGVIIPVEDGTDSDSSLRNVRREIADRRYARQHAMGDETVRLRPMVTETFRNIRMPKGGVHSRS